MWYITWRVGIMACVLYVVTRAVQEAARLASEASDLSILTAIAIATVATFFVVGVARLLSRPFRNPWRKQ